LFRRHKELVVTHACCCPVQVHPHKCRLNVRNHRLLQCHWLCLQWLPPLVRPATFKSMPILLTEPMNQKIATRVGKTSVQVVFQWCVQQVAAINMRAAKEGPLVGGGTSSISPVSTPKTPPVSTPNVRASAPFPLPRHTYIGRFSCGTDVSSWWAGHGIVHWRDMCHLNCFSRHRLSIYELVLQARTCLRPA
jgi:hypothetical protein